MEDFEKFTLGVDPGKTGGAVLLDEFGRIRESAAFDYEDFGEFMRRIDEKLIRRAYVEKVHSMPKQGIKSAFSFGTSFGFLLGGLSVKNISVELCAPQKWQKKMIPAAKVGRAAKLKASRDLCKQLRPDFDFKASPRCTTMHSGLVVAYIIAEYGRLYG